MKTSKIIQNEARQVEVKTLRIAALANNTSQDANGGTLLMEEWVNMWQEQRIGFSIERVPSHFRILRNTGVLCGCPPGLLAGRCGWFLWKSLMREGSMRSSVVTQEFFSGPYPSLSIKCCSCPQLCLEVNMSLCLAWASSQTSSLCLDQGYWGNIGWFPSPGKMWRLVS